MPVRQSSEGRQPQTADDVARGLLTPRLLTVLALTLLFGVYSVLRHIAPEIGLERFGRMSALAFLLYLAAFVGLVYLVSSWRSGRAAIDATVRRISGPASGESSRAAAREVDSP
jgi:hypothetical protein